MSRHEAEVEFSRIVSLDRLGKDEQTHEIAANADECAALAERFGLVALDGLRATVRLRRVKSGRMVRLEGSLTADAVQSCIVTLEPVAEHVEESFTILFGPEAEDPGDEEVVIMSGDVETPEPLAGDSLDIGECVAQYFSLALNPYPRSEGAEATEAEGETRPSDGPEESPFRVLKALETRQKPS